MLFISLDRKVCLSEPKLNSVSLAAKAVVLKAESPNISKLPDIVKGGEESKICIFPVK